jgi:hypothetical protein
MHLRLCLCCREAAAIMLKINESLNSDDCLHAKEPGELTYA